MRTAIYPGSFDPVTLGHVSLIQRGLHLFDRLIVAVAHNPQKQSALFSVEERSDFIRRACPDTRVEVDTFSGLLVDYAQKRGVQVVLRGLRAVSDFEYEFQMANMNRHLAKNLETVFVMTGEDYFYVSSRLIREVASMGGRVSGLVPDFVEEKLREKFPAGGAS